jgi:hypothetical protein
MILLRTVTAEIEKTSRLKDIVSRVSMKAGRVYLYHLYEQQIPEDAILLKPLMKDRWRNVYSRLM